MTEHAARWTGAPAYKLDCYSTGIDSIVSSALARRFIRSVIDSGGHVIPASALPVLDPIEPGYSVRAPLAPLLSAGADEAETDALPYTDEQASVVVEDSDRIDPDVMEHTRQSRLQRWQRLP